MANLKDIKVRIASVQKTRQITSAMKLVAAAKLQRATANAMAAQPYRTQLQSVLERVAGASTADDDEPLLQARESVKTVQAVILTSDKGLCGPFNNGLMRKFEDWYAKRTAEGQQVTVHVVGKKGRDYLKIRKIPYIDENPGDPPTTERPSDVQAQLVNEAKTALKSGGSRMDLVRHLSSTMVSGFLDHEHDETVLVYNHFVNTLVQTPTFDTILPLTVEEDNSDVDRLETGDYRYEPDAAAILENLLPLYLRTLVLQAFLETEAGDHAARMTAMDNATRNAGDLIQQLRLDYNRARQAAITTEIIEITSGAAALE